MTEETNSNNKYNERQKIPRLRRALDTFGNMFGLNICFVVSCLPVFTIGASISALYAMCIRLQEDEEETIMAGYIHEFKRNFKQSTIAFLWILLALFIMFFEYMVVRMVPGIYATMYTFVLMLELIVMFLILPFIFPIIARYKTRVGEAFRNSLVFGITYFWSCVKINIAWFAPIALCIIYPNIFVQIWWLWLLLIFGMIAYGTSFTVRKVFRKNEERMEKAEEAAKEAARKAAEEDEEDEDDETLEADESDAEDRTHKKDAREGKSESREAAKADEKTEKSTKKENNTGNKPDKDRNKKKSGKK